MWDDQPNPLSQLQLPLPRCLGEVEKRGEAVPRPFFRVRAQARRPRRSPFLPPTSPPRWLRTCASPSGGTTFRPKLYVSSAPERAPDVTACFARLHAPVRPPCRKAGGGDVVHPEHRAAV